MSSRATSNELSLSQMVTATLNISSDGEETSAVLLSVATWFQGAEVLVLFKEE